MKRAAGLILIVVLCAFGQTARDAYRTAYREWREADPSLERDAGSISADLAGRSAKVGAGAASYGSVRGEFLRQMADDEAQKLAWLQTPPDAPSAMILEGASTLMAAATRTVRRTMDTYAADPDPGIRQLRATLARESTAADALVAAMEKRKRAAEAVKGANSAVAEAQLKAVDQDQAVEADAKQSIDEGGQEAAAWAQYYALLATGARTPSAPPTAAPVSVTPTASVPPSVPLIRFTGAWAFPAMGMYHGPQPVSIDLLVREENGHASGTLTAKFKLPPGSAGDPVVKFDFTGEFKTTRTQVFNATSSDGSKGTIELIPGPAFNLLEVNFQLEPKPGKIRQGNVVLLKQ